MANKFDEIHAMINTLAEQVVTGAVTPSGLASILRRMLVAVESIEAAGNAPDSDLAALVESAVAAAASAQSTASTASATADNALLLSGRPVRFFHRSIATVQLSAISDSEAPARHSIAWAENLKRFVAYDATAPAPTAFFAKWPNRDRYQSTDGVINAQALFALVGSDDTGNAVSLYVSYGGDLVKALPGDTDLSDWITQINGKFSAIDAKFTTTNNSISTLQDTIESNRLALETKFSSFATVSFNGCIDVQMPSGTITPNRKFGVPSIGYVAPDAGASSGTVAEVWYSFALKAFIGSRGTGANKRWFSSWLGSDAYNVKASDGTISARQGLKCACENSEWIVDRGLFRPTQTAVIDFHDFGDASFDTPGVPPFIEGFFIDDTLISALITARSVRFVASNGTADITVASTVTLDDGTHLLRFAPFRDSNGNLIEGTISIDSNSEIQIDFQNS